MPPGFKAKVGCLETFQLPEQVTGSAGDLAMGKALVDAWKRDGSKYMSRFHNVRRLGGLHICGNHMLVSCADAPQGDM